MQQRPAAREIWLFLLYLGLGLASGFMWVRLADLPRLPDWHFEMISGQAEAPNQYRPLTPWLAEVIRRMLPGGNLYLAYLLLRSLVTGLSLFAFDRYLHVWFRPSAAAAGALALAAILPFTYMPVTQVSDPINLLVFILAFHALAVDRDRHLIPLILIGTLNRETTALLPAVYFLARLGQRPMRQILGNAFVQALCWVVVYGGLRLLYGHREYYCPVIMWEPNTATLQPTLQVFLLYGIIWIAAVVGARTGPVILRRAMWLLPFYLALHYVVAMCHETRLYLPYAPVLIPLTWWILFPESRRSEPSTPSPKRRGSRRAG
ncbi:MAG: hypothetical protein JXA57_01520 [Armatimonadetes bacterium]|nr:hypothetical protein [Armatimonadota bacterium]